MQFTLKRLFIQTIIQIELTICNQYSLCFSGEYYLPVPKFYFSFTLQPCISQKLLEKMNISDDIKYIQVFIFKPVKVMHLYVSVFKAMFFRLLVYKLEILFPALP